MPKREIKIHHEDGQWKNRVHSNSQAGNVNDTWAATRAAGRASLTA